MNELLTAMMSVLVAWLGLAFIFTGLGLMFRRSFGLAPRDASSLLTCFWMGWALAIAILQLWHLEFPVDWRAFVLVSTIGMAGLLWNAKDLWDLITKPGRQKWVLCSILILAAIWLANRAIDAPHNYDTGLYHFQAVRWTTSYPVVPGLGNLHGRLAFNSSYFLYVAMLEIGPWTHKAHHIANGLLLLVVFAQVLLSGFKLFSAREGRQMHHVFYLVLLTPILRQFLLHDISSPSPDLPIFVLSVIVFGQLLNYLVGSHDTLKESEYAVLTIAVLSVLGISIKLNFTGLGIASVLLVLAVRFTRTRGHGRAVLGWTRSWILVCTVLIVLPWMARGVFLSGYIAYPSTVGSFPVEWRIAREAVVDMANYVRTWYVKPHVHWSKVLGNWDWFIPWLYKMSKHYYDVVIPVCLGFVGVISLAVNSGEHRQEKMNREVWLFLLIPVASLILWFIAAPNPRYASVWFWLLAAGAIGIAVGGLGESKRRKMICVVLVLSIVLAVTPLLDKDKFIGPGSSDGFYGTPRADLKKFTTHSGLMLYAPVKGDQCWDAPLPCTPYPNFGLRLRKKGDMQHGFMLDSGEGRHAGQL